MLTFISTDPSLIRDPGTLYADSHPQLYYNIDPALYTRPSLQTRHVDLGDQFSATTILPNQNIDDAKEGGRCPHPDCGKVFHDLKAHLLTHQNERPEKCPILTCEYNRKGFARKYDKNRHTLTHYKGTMVCGFCPGSGSPAEKSFTRADVFKRHLTSIHGVQQTPPNSRKGRPSLNNRKVSSYCKDATGKCSTCAQTFNDAQDFYEHLDDCVLRIVQQEVPGEDINAQPFLTTFKDDNIQKIFDLNVIKTEVISSNDYDEDDYSDDDDKEAGEREEDDEDEGPLLSRTITDATLSKGKPLKKGMTWSKGGVALVGKARKKRKHYPPSWGMSAEKMRMKKRVLCVYDGDRRLWKDDQMMHNEFEVRMELPDGTTYVTDLDVETMKRANAFHSEAKEAKGLWDQDQQQVDLDALMDSGLIAKTSVPHIQTLEQSAMKTSEPPQQAQTQNARVPVLKLATADCEAHLRTGQALPSTETGRFHVPHPASNSTLDPINRPPSTNQGKDRAKEALSKICHLEEAGDPPAASTKTENDYRLVSWQPQQNDDQLTDSEGEMSFMATPALEDLQDDHSNPPNPEWVAIKSAVAGQIAKSYAMVLVRGHRAPNQRTQPGGSSTPPTSSKSGSTLSQTTSPRRNCAKRRLSSIDGEQGNDEDDERPVRRPKIPVEYKAADDGKLLACPYSKFDSTRYSELNMTEQQYRGCSSCFLTTIPRMKQHLYRVHSRPKHYCSCCFQSFQTGDLLDQHARARSCVLSQSPFEEKMTADQMTEIKRRTPGKERTKSWFTIFRILFPQADLPQSPFINKYSEDCVQHFLSHFEREAPGRLAATINSELGNSALILSFDQRRILDEVLEISLSRFVTAMAQYGRAAQAPRRREPQHSTTPNNSYLQTPPREISEDATVYNSSTESRSPIQPRHATLQQTPRNSEPSQEGSQTHRVPLEIGEHTDEHRVNFQSADLLALFPGIEDLPAFPGMSDDPLTEYGDSDFVDHNLANACWQRLYHDGAQFGSWNNGVLHEEDTL